MIAQCNDLSIKRTAAPKSKGLTRAQAEAAIAAKGHDINSPKVQKIIEAIFASN